MQYIFHSYVCLFAFGISAHTGLKHSKLWVTYSQYVLAFRIWFQHIPFFKMDYFIHLFVRWWGRAGRWDFIRTRATFTWNPNSIPCLLNVKLKCSCGAGKFIIFRRIISQEMPPYEVRIFHESKWRIEVMITKWWTKIEINGFRFH